jgi:predicted enzyme related to lactoylglutathione lyase
MANRQGDFIWYELLTKNPEGAKRFYAEVVGWNIGESLPGEVEYREISAGDGFVGGVLTLSEEMVEQGARPVWLGYVAVENVDATLEKIERLDGKVLMAAKDIPNVGRFALVADPQGIPFYIMRGAVDDQTSTAYNPKAMGHCAWNELTTTDQDGALTFYRQLFGWENRESMPMGQCQYKFINQSDEMIGAVSPQVDSNLAPAWAFYFNVPDIDKAMEKTEAQGGEVLMGPHEVPGGDYVIIGRDPEGVTFALVGAKGR